MNASQALRPRRYSGVFSQPWDVAALDGNMSGLDISRPKSAPPVENQWFSQRALDDNASDETQSECVSSDSSDESSPPSTRPSSPPAYFGAKFGQQRTAVYVGSNEYELHGAQPLYRDAHQTRVGEGIPRRTMYVVLERASMELCRAPPATHGRQAKQKPTLLTCDDHQGLLVRMGREVSDARPDITHQCLLTLLDSPLNKAGLLKIFIHTTQGLLIEVHPDVRIPRTYKRYSGLMVQLLQQGEIRGASDSQVLMRILDHPISHYLPNNTVKLALSADARTVHPHDLLRAVPQTHSLALFVGAHAKGPDDFAEDVVEGKVSLSSYALSASVVCGKVCCAMEDLLCIF